MAVAILYCTFILLLYLQGNNAQQCLANNQNGANNAINNGLQQQTLPRTNTPNSINQIPNGGFNINFPQQSNSQQGNLQQPINGNLQGNFQQSLSIPPSMQVQGTSGPLPNMQSTKQGFVQLTPGLVASPSKSQTMSSQQFNNAGARQNSQTPEHQNKGPTSNGPMSQTQNGPFSSNSIVESAALNGNPSLLSLFGSQNTAQPQQNQPIGVPNFNPTQNQLTDVQKQFLVRNFQFQSSGQNQPEINLMPSQFRAAGSDNQPTISFQGQTASPQLSQAIVTPMGNQPAYITVQAQPLNAYMQNQQPPQLDEQSMQSHILPELQPSNSQYTYPQYNISPYTIQKKPKSSLKAILPLIINLLKEKNGCGCRNCGCTNKGCGNNQQEPSVFSGYSNQKNYSHETEKSSTTTRSIAGPKNNNNAKEQNNVKTNIVNVDSEELSEENDSEYEDDSEGD